MGKHIHKKTNKKHGKSKKRTNTRNRRRKIKGGVSFNDAVTSHPISPNGYMNDPSHGGISSRTLPFSQLGGKTTRRRGKGKGKKSRKSKKMKGGSLTGTDLITGINTSGSNDALAFGGIGGSQYMMEKLSGGEMTTASNLTSENHLVPMV